MKTLYFDCIGGISGDMILGALIDAGLSVSVLKNDLEKLNLKKYVSKYEIKINKTQRGHIQSRKFNVVYKDCSCEPLSLKQITDLIKKSKLDDDIRELSLRIYEKLASAERKAHQSKDDDLKFHQLGEIDSIIDIVGISIAIKNLKIDTFVVSAIPLGRNTGAATLELINHLPVCFTDSAFETITPTGAAVLSALEAKPAESKGCDLKIDKVGYGAGSNNPENASNVLRVIIAETKSIFTEDRVTVLESNIDDMNPQDFEYVQDSLLKAGALDVYLQTVQMKKSRVGFLLTALIKPGQLGNMAKIIFKETTTLGIRYYDVNRKKVNRRIEKIKTQFGNVRVKIGSLNGSVNTISPEHDDCRVLAQKTKEPLRKIYEEAKLETSKIWR